MSEIAMYDAVTPHYLQYGLDMQNTLRQRNYRCLVLLTVSYRVIAKVLYLACLNIQHCSNESVLYYTHECNI